LPDASIEVPFDADDAAVAGSILGRMQLAGRQIGSIDSLIAGHALSRGFALVTNNTKHYERIAGLQLFNWV
jgi:tRNA(fMet)-specific endonuclease VapC